VNKLSLLVGAVAVLALAGCSSTPAPAASTSAPTTAQAGPSAFLKFAHAASFGNKDFKGATDAQLLDSGNQTCTGLGSQILFGQVVQVYIESGAKPSPAEAEAFARQAVTNLCPQYAGGQTHDGDGHSCGHLTGATRPEMKRPAAPASHGPPRRRATA
jgi:hypothetical protein